ncbi:hypothetical protein B0J12DRAFT_705657 [Macrophomina phaseolina]|uniref:Uncharacterized protein n=1 Tax=Macrophomina phaseolina TaxID=35725 RepID=A0ABQ8FSI0_9PEZI|nr:hypothetical protein B0J12DRAFT_705657 [Macrophomina phaseolina]
MSLQTIRKRPRNRSQQMLYAVQRKAENKGAITLRYLTSSNYLKKTKAELFCNNVNLVERVKELNWEIKCLEWESVLYGGLHSVYIMYAREIPDHVKALRRAWDQEKCNDFTRFNNREETVRYHIYGCKSRLEKVFLSECVNIGWYRRLWNLEPTQAWTKRTRKPRKHALLRTVGSTMKKVPDPDIDLSIQIEKLVETKSKLLQSLTYKYDLVATFMEIHAYAAWLLKLIRIGYSSWKRDRRPVAKQQFEKNLDRLSHCISRNFDVMIGCENRVYFPEQSGTSLN